MAGREASIPVRLMVAFGREEPIANPSLVPQEQRREMSIKVTETFEVPVSNNSGPAAALAMCCTDAGPR
jgi:hypothetical protein